MILTNFFLNREVRKLKGKASSRPHQYRSLDEIRNILFICDAKDWDIARKCIEKLKSLKKNVNTAIFSPSEKEVPTWYSNYLLLRADKDVNLWGFPSKSIQKQFNSLQADMIIDFSGEDSIAMQYLFLHHPSTFKVGIKHSEDSDYDFSIIPPKGKNDLLYLFDQLLNYLQSISSKK